MVRKPTRGKYLLDLVLTDMAAAISTQVSAGISDHNSILSRLELRPPTTAQISRVCHDYARADWNGLLAYLQKMNWSQHMPLDDPDAAVLALGRVLESALQKFVPIRRTVLTKSERPWISDRCRAAVREKISAFGTAEFANKQEACSQIFLEEHRDFVQRTASRLEQLPSSSKQWWSLAKTLMRQSQRPSSVPPLRRHDGSWALSSADKAEALSDVFCAKSRLPQAVVNQHSRVAVADAQMGGFLPVRARLVE